MNNDLILWQPESGQLIPKEAKTPAQITSFAAQLSRRDIKQIVAAYDSQHFEMGINFLWGKTVSALKKELATVGIGLLGEMLDKPGLDDDDDVEDILTTKESIRLAEELGVVTSTDAMRLRHTYEIISHFSQLELNESDLEEIDEAEALSSLKSCIKAVLGRPKVEVAKKFVEFREALEGETLTGIDGRVVMLNSSPYFFKKLTVSVLMNGAKKNTGAQLEHILANMNVLIPNLWSDLRDTERWQVGHTYAETYADGKTSSVAGIKKVLLKVKGFDYVPETLRSDTFIKAANSIIKAHEGLNNFYNELAPVKNFTKLGTTIPIQALAASISALLSIVLGNRYGVAWDAESEASNILNNLSSDRWEYYLNHVLPSDTRILNKLSENKPSTNWINLVKKYQFDKLQLKNKNVTILVKASLKSDYKKIMVSQTALLTEYYGDKDK